MFDLTSEQLVAVITSSFQVIREESKTSPFTGAEECVVLSLLQAPNTDVRKRPARSGSSGPRYRRPKSEFAKAVLRPDGSSLDWCHRVRAGGPMF